MPSRVVVVAAVAALVSVPLMARPDRPGSDLFTFDAGDVVETFDTDGFRLHFTRAGTHAVPLADADSDGVPDHVQRLGTIYEEALGAYALLGFRPPVSDDGFVDNGGDGRFDVYLVDFGRSADGAYRAERCEGAICSGYMIQENDFRGYGYPSVDVGNRTVASHELFHAVQAAYDTDQGAVFSEATAVWASERYDPTLRDLEGYAHGYLEDAATPLDAGGGGPVDSFTYGAGIFFEYLSERFDDDVTLALWEAVADDVDASAFWFDEIDGVLAARGSSFADAFAEFSTWTLLTGRRADPDRSFENGGQMALREPIARTLPIDEGSFVVFTASSRLLTAPTRERPTLQVVLGGADVARDGARVFVLPLGDEGPLDVIEATAGEAFDVGDAFEVLVLVVNTRREGGSIRPRLCVGAPDEVAACAIPAEGEGEGEGENEDDPRLAGGGCAQSSSSMWSPLALLAGLAAVASGRRRRR
jgi:hypothetical protein